MARTSTDTAARATKTAAPLIICFLLSILLTIYKAFYAINNNIYCNGQQHRTTYIARKYTIDLINKKYITMDSSIEQHILQEKYIAMDSSIEFHCKIDVLLMHKYHKI
jgi:hypothetical protein